MSISTALRKVPTHIRQRAIELVASTRRSARNSEGRSLGAIAQQGIHDADLSFSATAQREERKPADRSLGATVRQGAYALAQVTWGFPQTALGFVVFLAHVRRPHFRFHGAVVTTWESHKAMSAGLFVFIHGLNGTSESGRSGNPSELGGSGGSSRSDGLGKSGGLDSLGELCKLGGASGSGGSGRWNGLGELGGSGDLCKLDRSGGSNESSGSHESADPIDVRASVDRPLLVHEYGHTIQSLVLGPLYLVIIGLPSVVWMNVPALSRWRARTGTSYYAFYTERWANTLGERVLGEPSVGLAKID